MKENEFMMCTDDKNVVCSLVKINSESQNIFIKLNLTRNIIFKIEYSNKEVCQMWPFVFQNII